MEPIGSTISALAHSHPMFVLDVQLPYVCVVIYNPSSIHWSLNVLHVYRLVCLVLSGSSHYRALCRHVLRMRPCTPGLWNCASSPTHRSPICALVPRAPSSMRYVCSVDFIHALRPDPDMFHHLLLTMKLPSLNFSVDRKPNIVIFTNRHCARQFVSFVPRVTDTLAMYCSHGISPHYREDSDTSGTFSRFQCSHWIAFDGRTF